MKNKSTFQIVTIGVFVVFTLIGIVYFATGGGTGPDKSKINYGKVTIWGTLPDSLMQETLKNIRSAKLITVDITYKQEPESSLLEDMKDALLSDHGPDLVILPYGHFMDYSRYVYPIPYEPVQGSSFLGTLTERDFRNTFVEQSEVYLGKEGVYAVPLVIDPMVMYWNRNIFSSNGVSQPPSLWDEFETLTPKMTVRDQTALITRSTIPFGEYANVTHAKDILSMLMMQLGAPVISSDKGKLTVDINSPVKNIYPAKTAFEFFTEFSNPALPTYSWNRSLPSSKNMFVAGDSAVYFGYASELPEIKKTNPHLDFDVATVPQRRDADRLTYGRVSGIAILNKSSNRAGAFEVLKLLSGMHDGNTIFLEQISKGLNLPPAHRVLLGKKPSDPYLSIFYDSANISKSWPDPNPQETDRLFANAIEGTLSSPTTVSVWVTGLSRQLDQIVTVFQKNNK